MALTGLAGITHGKRERMAAIIGYTYRKTPNYRTPQTVEFTDGTRGQIYFPTVESAAKTLGTGKGAVLGQREAEDVVAAELARRKRGAASNVLTSPLGIASGNAARILLG